MSETSFARRIAVLRREVAAEQARAAAGPPKRRPFADKAELRRLYHGPQQLSIQLIANRFAVSASAVRKALVRYGIPRRSKVVALAVARKHGRRPRRSGEVFGADYGKEGSE